MDVNKQTNSVIVGYKQMTIVFQSIQECNVGLYHFTFNPIMLFDVIFNCGAEVLLNYAHIFQTYL